MTMTERIRPLFKINGRSQKVSGYERRHLCDISSCRYMSYSWKEFDIHSQNLIGHYGIGIRRHDSRL
jgi:hypothetical protein